MKILDRNMILFIYFFGKLRPYVNDTQWLDVLQCGKQGSQNLLHIHQILPWTSFLTPSLHSDLQNSLVWFWYLQSIWYQLNTIPENDAISTICRYINTIRRLILCWSKASPVSFNDFFLDPEVTFPEVSSLLTFVPLSAWRINDK